MKFIALSETWHEIRADAFILISKQWLFLEATLRAC